MGSNSKNLKIELVFKTSIPNDDIQVESGSILANVSSSRPLFTITGLNPGVELRLLIRSVHEQYKKLTLIKLLDLILTIYFFVHICSKAVFIQSPVLRAFTNILLFSKHRIPMCRNFYTPYFHFL